MRRLVRWPVAGIAAVISFAPRSAALAQDSALVAALTEHRYTMSLEDGTLAGRGATLLLDAGRRARFFLIGEEHGVAEVPRLTSALFAALVPAGYRHLAIETSEALAVELNRRAAGPNPARALAGLTTSYWPGAPFYRMTEEADLLVAAVVASGRRADLLWGLDYDMVGDRYALRRLRGVAPNAAARAAADRLIAHADSAWAAAMDQRNPGLLYMFGGAAEPLAAVRRAYAPQPGSEADRILRVLERTLEINHAQGAGRFHEANTLRARLLKEQFTRYYTAAGGSLATGPRVMFKFGANHVVQGRNFTNTYDIGTLAHEIAQSSGGSAFGVMVVGGAGTHQSLMDPTTIMYRARPVGFAAAAWAKPLFALADPERWTVYDFRGVRGLLSAGRLGAVSPGLAQVVYGFDAFVVLSGSRPATDNATRP